MTIQEYNKAIRLLKDLNSIKTWTARKHLLFKEVIKIMKSGTHEYFTSKPQYHCEYIGSYYTENKSHKRRGTLFKYRGHRLLVVCCSRGTWNTRGFLIAIIN